MYLIWLYMSRSLRESSYCDRMAAPRRTKPTNRGAKWKLRAALAALLMAAWSNSLTLGFASDGAAAVRDVRIQSATSENIAPIFGKHYCWPNAADRLACIARCSQLPAESNSLRRRPGRLPAVNLLLPLTNA